MNLYGPCENDKAKRYNIVRECVDADVRLVGSIYSHQGRLEVNVGGIWGTVCDDYFDNRDAAVACSMLGYGYVSNCACVALLC